MEWSINGVAFKSVQYSYDEFGKRTALTEPENAVVRYSYDPADRFWKITRQAPGDV